MAHKMIIAKVDKLIPIDGADRVQIAMVLGEYCIVGKDITEGYLGVLFPADLQLSEEYCRLNNLYRDSSLNDDPTKKGFFDKNRKVRAQKFLKVNSTAYFTSLESLSYTGKTDWSVNDRFNDINKHHICKRFESDELKRKKANIQNSNARKQDEIPLFLKHTDTDNFAHNVHKIQEGALLSFHSKRHGCFDYNARVRLWDGSVKAISKIKIGDVVVGYDTNGLIIPSKVINVWNNGRYLQPWVKLKFNKIKRTRGNPYYRVTCTENHKFLTKTGWKEAKDLSNKDIVVATIPSYVYSNDQIAALIGMYLGDGYLTQQGNLQFVHKRDHESYVDWKHSLFEGQHTKKVHKVSGYGSDVVCSMLRSSPHIRDLFGDAQKDKRVDDWMVDKCTPLTLAIIYMDDGSLHHSEFQQDRAELACCGIPDEYIGNYLKMFEKFGIKPTLYVDRRGYSRIRFNKDEANKLWELIKGYIPDVMKYKFPSGYDFGEVVHVKQGRSGFIERETTLLSKENFDGRLNKYDLQTETENYVVSNIVVHNSSARYGYLPMILELPKWKKFINKYIPLFPTEKYEYVVGTRNVVLKNPEKEGFHGSESFRFSIMEDLKPHLQKGMCVYGEIVGNVNGSSVMPPHSISVLKNKQYTEKYGDIILYNYNCKENEYKFFIYRITMVGTDGVVYEFDQQRMEKWCRDRGLGCTLEIHPQMVYNGDKESLIRLVEQLTERPEVLTEDYSDSSHVSEGIIVRSDYQGVTDFYKSKSVAFKIMEGILNIDDMETMS